MLNLAQKLTAIAALSITAAGFSMTAQAGGMPQSVSVTAANFGSPETPDAATRTVTLTAATKAVNVSNGDTVKFVDGERSFTWHFDTRRDSASLSLAAIAPGDSMLQNVRVYVASNPLYHN